MKNKNNYNGDSAKNGRKYNPDQIIEPKDDSGINNKTIPPAGTMFRAKEELSQAESTSLFNRTAASQRYEQAIHSGNHIMKSMLHYKWTILAFFLVVAIPPIILIWTQITPEYQARAEVRVRPIIPYLVFQTDDNGMIPLYNSYLNTQVSIIRSLTVLQRVLDQQEIQKTQWYRESQKSLISRLKGNTISNMERLRDNLSVNPRRQTEIIDASFVAANANDAKLIMDTVLEQYIKYIREMSDATEDTLYRQLGIEYKSLENDIQAREKFISELLNKLGTGTPQELVSNRRINLDQSQVRLSELQQNIAILEWEQKQLEELINQTDAGDSNDIAIVTENQSNYSDDPEWRQLYINKMTIQHQIENSLYTSKTLEMSHMENDLKFAEELLRLRESQLDEQSKTEPIYRTTVSSVNYEKDLESLKYQWDRAKHEEKLLIENIKIQTEEFDKLFKSAQLLEAENNELMHKQNLFEAVRQRRDQKDMERNVPGSIEVSMGAFVPSQPYNDRRVVFTMMVIFLALGIGCGTAYLRVGKNQVLYTPEDIPLPMQIEYLGTIPSINLKRPIGKELGNEIKRKQFLLNESIRVIRTTLLSRLDKKHGATILISSSAPGTGKSSFARVLSKCMAQADRKVLLIDVDFYKKTLSKKFGLTDKPGIINCLNSNPLDINYISSTGTPYLDIMPVGKQDNGAMFQDITEGTFKKIIDKLRMQYDIILLDCSPIMPIADATIISSQVDGIIMVERELISHRDDLINAVTRLSSAGGHLTGIVFVK